MKHSPKRAHDPVDERGELAAGIAAGDRSAFERLHARLDGGLRRLFMRRSSGKSELADELVQRTWGQLWQAVLQGRYDPSRSAISTFVYAIANNIWLQQVRTSRRLLGELSDDTGAVGGPDDAISHAELLDALRDCLDRRDLLNHDERYVVVQLAQGATERSLATELSLAASTVHSRKLSALDKLRSCLEAKGFSSDSVEQIGGLLE